MNDKDMIGKLLDNQLTQCNNRFKFNDMKRIAKQIKGDPFGDQCCLWSGYITNSNVSKKGCYINFYYNSKKRALHRLMYENFIGPLSPNSYIKYTCINKGRCININHMNRRKYSGEEPIVVKPPVKQKDDISLVVKFD